MTDRLICLSLLAALAACATEPGGHAKYMGGSVAGLRNGLSGTIDTADHEVFIFATSSYTARIPYADIKLVEYVQEASRRVILAFAISPVFLLSKARAHFVTLHFLDNEGRQQALVLRVDKSIIRSTLATLEARTGRSVEYQDSEARKFRRG